MQLPDRGNRHSSVLWSCQEERRNSALHLIKGRKPGCGEEEKRRTAQKFEKEEGSTAKQLSVLAPADCGVSLRMWNWSGWGTQGLRSQEGQAKCSPRINEGKWGHQVFWLSLKGSGTVQAESNWPPYRGLLETLLQVIVGILGFLNLSNFPQHSHEWGSYPDIVPHHSWSRRTAMKMWAWCRAGWLQKSREGLGLFFASCSLRSAVIPEITLSFDPRAHETCRAKFSSCCIERFTRARWRVRGKYLI